MIVKRSILFSILFLVSLQGCAQNNPSESYSVKEFKEMISSKDSIVILDVRTDGEIVGPLTKIDGALHIPVQELTGRVNELEKYKDKEIVVICRTQNRSSIAAEFLREKGYNAKCVIGGMQEFYKSN